MRVSMIQYRVNADGIKEMRRSQWREGYEEYDEPLSLAFIAAAKRAHKGGSSVDATQLDANALAQLNSRRAQLLDQIAKLERMVEQVEVAIARVRLRMPN
jgi:hypothetical protein